MVKGGELIYRSYLNKRRICMYAFIVRIIALVCVITFSPQLSTGFSGSTTIQDDVRLLEGAKIYANQAKSIVDPQTLENAFDQVELAYHDASLMELDYWFFSIGLYLLGNELLLRLLNILIAVVSVYCLFEIALMLYGRKVAELSSMLYALMPYPIFFSCFLYKDQLYTLVFLLILRKALMCAKKLKTSDYVYFAIMLFISMWIRSGLVVLVLFAIVVMLYKRSSIRLNVFKVCLYTSLSCLVLIFLAYVSWDKIMLKYNHYVIEFETEGGSIVDYLTIKSPMDIYRYPFSYLFLLLIPLNYIAKMTTWYDVVGLLNVFAIPVAIGNFLYLFSYKLKKDYFFWTMQLFYLVAICTSLTIPRHQYFLQPLTMLFFALYYCRTERRFMWKSASTFVMAIILLLLTVNALR